MLYGSLNGRGIWGRIDTCIYMTVSLWCPPETIIMLLISYTPIENNKFFFFFFKEMMKVDILTLFVILGGMLSFIIRMLAQESLKMSFNRLWEFSFIFSFSKVFFFNQE